MVGWGGPWLRSLSERISRIIPQLRRKSPRRALMIVKIADFAPGGVNDEMEAVLADVVDRVHYSGTCASAPDER